MGVPNVQLLHARRTGERLRARSGAAHLKWSLLPPRRRSTVRDMRPTHLAVFRTALSMCLGSSSLIAQGSERGAFLTRLGTDTIAVEEFTRTASRLEGDIVVRNPRTRTIHYILTMDGRGSTTHFEMKSHFEADPAGTPPLIERNSTITDTTLTNDVRRNGVRDTAATGTVGVPRGTPALPFTQNAIAFFDQMAHELKASGRDSIAISQFTFAPSAVFPSYARRGRGDSVEINIGLLYRGRMNKAGQLTALSARATTVKTETVRIPPPGLTKIVAAWVARETAGRVAGAVSGRDTVTSKVGSAELWLDYGRPSRRGRQIFGVLVPWDTVWRTGANAATQFRTSADLDIGGTQVPAGIYTLWTIPTPTGGLLVVNKQSGQWGTQYDSTQDLVRVPLHVTTVAQPVDTFTMQLPTGGTDSVLRFTWDTRQFWVPIVIK